MSGLNDNRYKDIGRKVAFYRNLRGYSQATLADKIVISRSYLSQIEAPKSEKAFSLDVLFSISDGLDIDIAAFFNPTNVESKYFKKK